MDSPRHMSLHFRVASVLFAGIVIYTTLVTLETLNDGSLLKKINILMATNATRVISNFMKHAGYPLLRSGFSLNNSSMLPKDTPHLEFMALKPYGPNSGYIPPEVKNGHPYLRQRTYPTTRRVEKCNNCFQFTYKTLLSPNVCDGKPKVELLTIVTTVPGTARARAAIRETWGRFSTTKKGENVTKPVFLFGIGWKEEEQAIIDSEHQIHHDVLQADYVDSYFNLSIKVLSGFHWFRDNCKQAQYILRTADDNYINIPNMLSMIRRESGRMQNCITGQGAPGSFALRGIGSKWYVTQNEYPQHRYPPYCTGTAFLTSGNLTRKIIQTSVNVPYFVIEDVYFGLVMREMNNGSTSSSILGMHGFGLPNPVSQTGVCRLSGEHWFAAHGINAGQMHLIFKHCQRSLDWFNV